MDDDSAGKRGAVALTVAVVDRFVGAPGDAALAQRAAAAATAFAGLADAEIVVMLTDDAEIAHLHGVHLGDPTPTDVMSFAMGDSVQVVVSVECVERQACAHGAVRECELALYVVHGVLHACGFDDRDVEARARMRAAERAVLQELGMRVPRFE
ncbi:MAG: rRNA maturation RNase YbeY [Planctomycetota bacterium]